MALREKVVLLVASVACALLASIVFQQSAARAEAERVEGDIPVAGGIALVRDVRGGAIDSLREELAAKECDAVSAWVSREGALVGYIFGAPAHVNTRFLETYPSGMLPAQTPLMLLCGASQEGASLVYLGVEKIWNEPPAPPVREEAEYYMYLFELRGAILTEEVDVSTSFPYAELPHGFISIMEEENRVGVVVRPWAPAYGSHTLRVHLSDGTAVVGTFRHTRRCDSRPNWEEIQAALGIPEGLCLLWLDSPEQVGRWDGFLRSLAIGLFHPDTRVISVAGWKTDSVHKENREDRVLAHEACHEWQEMQNRLAHGEALDAPPAFWNDPQQYTEIAKMWHEGATGSSYNEATGWSFDQSREEWTSPEGKRVPWGEAGDPLERFAVECSDWVLLGENAEIPEASKAWMRQALPQTSQ